MNQLDFEIAFDRNLNEVGYLEMIEASVKRFRNKQKEEILKMINKVNNQHPIINDILNIDVSKMEMVHNSTGSYMYVYSQSDFTFFKVLFHFIRNGMGEVSERILIKKLRTK